MTAQDKDSLTRQVGHAEAVRQAFEQMPVALAGLTGSEHTVVAANAAYRAIAGGADVIGRSIRQLFPGTEGRRLRELYDRVYETGMPQTAREWRVRLIRPDGTAEEEAYFDCAAAPTRGPDGAVSGVTSYFADVTGQVMAREKARAPTARPRAAEGRQSAAAQNVVALQEALLSAGLPVLPGARIAARYLVAGHDQASGGDWFDAIPLPGGRVALVVGDVVGHGVAASAAMGQLRAVLRYLLAAQPDLTAALAQLDRFAADDRALQAATLCLAVLTPGDGGLCYVTCGHPAPLVVAPDGTARYLPPTAARPLGTAADPDTPLVPGTATLEVGEIVLLYSDGLVARPGRTLDEGMADLAVVAGDAAASRTPHAAAATPAERVCQLSVELLARAGYADDVTTLAAQRLPEIPRELAVELTAERGSVITARRSLDGWLNAIGVATADRQIVELAVTEAVTNAVEHAYPPGRPGPVRVDAALSADGYLEARVSDRGRWRAPEHGNRGHGQGLMLAAQLIDEVRVSHPPQEAGAQSGIRGTVVTLRHSLHRPAMLASQATGPAPVTQVPPPMFAAELVIGEPGAQPAVSVRVTGPVDSSTAERLTGQLMSACRGGVLPLTVDLSAVTILASAGVRVLYQVKDQLTAHGEELTLVSASGSPAAVVLDLVRLPRSAGIRAGAAPEAILEP